MAKFGLGKSVPNQGGIAKANVQAPRVSDEKGSCCAKTPGLSDDAAKTNIRPKPVGGSGTTHSGPKPFRK